MADLNQLLTGFTRLRGVTAALLVGQDGLPLDRAVAPGTDEADADSLGARAASWLVPAQEIGQDVGRGALRQAIYEYEQGVVVVEPMGDFILVLVTDVAANLGLLRLQAHKVRPELTAALA